MTERDKIWRLYLSKSGGGGMQKFRKVVKLFAWLDKQGVDYGQTHGCMYADAGRAVGHLPLAADVGRGY